MRFVFISTPTFEPWDWTNPDTKGIGGSETSHIEMAQRLAKLGHEVFSFAPTGRRPIQWERDNDEFPVAVEHDRFGVNWFDFSVLAEYAATRKSFAGFFETEPDVWIIYRAPELIDFIPKGAICWLICQDVDYTRKGQELTEERIEKLTRLVGLCKTHQEYFKARYPKARVSLSSNGIKRAIIEQILKDPPERNPHRLMYASSPDRGMEFLLQMFPRIREMVPDAELHIYYGFDNIEKVVAHMGKNSRVGLNTARLQGLLEQPGVSYHGRTGQPELLREWFKAGIWAHPSNFTETSCITCMDAQACGAIPVTSPVWAIAENVQHGVFIEGNVKNPVVQARYVHQIFSLMVQPELQAEIRQDMMPWALETFNWDIFAQQWQGWARRDTRPAETPVTTELRCAVDEAMAVEA